MINNICILIKSLQTGGAEKQALLLSRVLFEKYHVYLVVLDGNKANRKIINELDSQNTEYYLLKGFITKRIIQLYSVLKKNKTDLLFCYLTGPNLYGSFIGRLLPVKYVISGVRNSKLPHGKYIIQKWVHNYLSHFTIFNNFKGAEHYKSKGFNHKKIIIIQNGIDILTPLIIRKKTNQIKIITVARFVEAKDFKTALLSFQYLLELIDPEIYDLQYLIIGSGPLKMQILQWINEMDLSKYVKIIPDPNNLSDYYLESDIYLSTSYFEGLPNSIMEAMSYSLPVVATDVGDIGRLVIDLNTGFLTKKYEYQTIASKLKELMENYQLRIEFGKNGYMHCTENYSVKKFTKSYIDFIETLR